MKKTEYQYPSEEVKLPSKGLLYPKDSPLRKGFIEMKYMTAKEEDILSNANFIQNGTVIDKLLKYGLNEFEFTLPTSKILLTFKFLTHGDESAIDREIKGLQKINKNASIEGSTRLKHIIVAVDGDREQKTIREFVDNRFLARDAREFRKYIDKIQPSVDLKYNYEDRRGNIEKINIPVGINFFWPDATI